MLNHSSSEKVTKGNCASRLVSPASRAAQRSNNFIARPRHSRRPAARISTYLTIYQTLARAPPFGLSAPFRCRAICGAIPSAEDQIKSAITKFSQFYLPFLPIWHRIAGWMRNKVRQQSPLSPLYYYIKGLEVFAQSIRAAQLCLAPARLLINSANNSQVRAGTRGECLSGFWYFVENI